MSRPPLFSLRKASARLASPGPACASRAPRRWSPRRETAPLVWALLLVALCAHGCSASDEGQTGFTPISPGPSAGAEGEPGAEGAPGGDAPGSIRTPVSVLTLASPTTAQAGEPVDVVCAALDAEGEWIDDVPTLFEVVEATGTHDRDLAAGTVVFHRVGAQRLRCRVEGSDLFDTVGRQIEVIAGPPTQLDTAVTPHEIVAGDTVALTCQAWDAYGNLNEWAKIEPWLSIPHGYATQGLQVKIAKAGLVDVACSAPDHGVVGTPPVQVKVKPGPPRIVKAVITPPEIEAGGSAGFDCVATDAWGNPVSGFPMSVQKPAALVVQGKSVSSFVAGIYELRCVPSSDPWEWYEIVPGKLQVHSGPPAELYVELIPAKPVYQKNDTLQMAVQILDVFGNVSAGAELEPIEIEPEEGTVELSPTSWRFVDEALYTFTLTVQDHPHVYAVIQVPVDGQGPLLVIDQPPRGATLADKPAVNVTGFVDDAIAGVLSLTINGSSVPVKPDGTFTHLMIAQQGMNLIVAEAMDFGGQVTRTSRSFFYSTRWYPIDASKPTQGQVDDGLMFWLGQMFLDRGAPNLDKPKDVASILLKFLQTFDILSSIPSPATQFSLIGSWNYSLFIQNVGYNPPSLSLKSFDNGLRIDFALPHLFMNVKLVGKCQLLFFNVCPDFSGQITANPIRMITELLVGAGPSGAPTMVPGATTVNLVGLKVSINGILGQLFDFLINWLVGLFKSDIEKSFAQDAGAEASKLVTELFDALALDTTFEIPPLAGTGPPTTLALGSHVSTLAFSNAGGVMGLGANVVTAKGVAQSPLGSIGRASCLAVVKEPPYLPPELPFGLALHDDLINQALFSVWWSGALNVALSEEDLASLGDLGALGDFGLENVSLSTVFFAAPMLTSCNPAQQMKLQIGDLFLSLSGDLLGLPITVGIFLSMEAEASIEMVANLSTGAKEVGITLQGISRVELEVVSVSEVLAGAKEWITELLEEELVGGLLGALDDDVLPGFPIPEIDLSTLDPSFPPGTVLDIQFSQLRRWAGYTALDGEMP